MSKVRKNNFGLVMAIYLAGIFMGAIDTGIVTPVRTVIQSALGVDDQTGIWMITIYTLAYAASIPIMGKLADTYGRKHVYLISISLFGIGSLACGLSSYFGSFSVLLTARVIQAIGGGGILPVATAEFGTSFPEEKRGMALGLVGGVYGIANIFGSSAGSAIVDIFGHDNWAYIFFINIPITLFIIIAGSVVLDNNKSVNTSKLDFAGIITLTVMILSLLYGLKNIDFFNIGQTITDIKVYPFLILFVLLVPVFILAEKKAKDPVMNLGYFTDKNILITLIISLISGIVMMGMIFIPQFSENALRIQSGSGGYFVIVLGLFAGIGAPVSGKLIDKFGAKLILGFGFAVSAAGAAFLAFVAASHPNIATVLISLGLIGTGIGFTMGTPLNYMMLDNTDDKESNSALAALSLVRSIGTAVAPAVMVGFIAHAGMLVKDNVMAQMPGVVNMPELPYAQEIQDEVDKMKNDPSMKDMADKMQIPDLTRMSMDMDMTSTDSGFEMSPEITELLQSSDVTTITENSKQMAEYMFGQMTPPVISSIQDGIQKGIDSINDSSEKMQKTLETMQTAASAMSDGQMPAMGDGQMPAMGDDQMPAMGDGQMPAMGDGQMPAMGDGQMPAMGDGQMPYMGDGQMPAMGDGQMPYMGDGQMPATGDGQMPAMGDGQMPAMGDGQMPAMGDGQMPYMSGDTSDMKNAVEAMSTAIDSMDSLSSKMSVLKDAIPDAFKQASDSYLSDIDSLSGEIENTFASTMNSGFKNVYLTTTVSAAAAFALLLFYKGKNKKTQDEK